MEGSHTGIKTPDNLLLAAARDLYQELDSCDTLVDHQQAYDRSNLPHRLGKASGSEEYYFDQLASLALSKTLIHPIGHPSTTYQMILKQTHEIIGDSASLSASKPLITDWKLFTFKHFVDVTVPKSIQQTLQRKGKSSKDIAGADREDQNVTKTAVVRLKEQLNFLDLARKETLDLITLFENAEGSQEEDQGDRMDPDSADSGDDQ